MDNSLQLARLVDAAERIADALERQNLIASFAGGLVTDNPAAAIMFQTVMGATVERVKEMASRDALRKSVKTS